VVEDGAMVLRPRPGETGWKRYNHYIWTVKEYADFVVELDFKFGTNSGLFFRAGDLANPVDTGIEVQLTPRHTGVLLGGMHNAPVPVDKAKPREWNHMVVTVRGNIEILVELNGEKINEHREDLSKMRRKTLKSSIGFQDHGYPMWFRNIRIKELDAGKSSLTVPPQPQAR
jgi:hypothetical protein